MSTVPKILNFIGGELAAPASGGFLDNIDPATGRVYSLVPDSDAEDINRAVIAAQKASPFWSTTTAKDRAAYLNKLAGLIENRLEEFARAECVDNGTSIGFARAIVARAPANLRAFAAAIIDFKGAAFEKEKTSSHVLRQPYGVVATISPWNLPLLLFTWKLAPAIAAGNCIIAKPSELTPMTAFMFSQMVNEAGFPPGVISVVHGLGAKAGKAITEHPDISAISFTGGTATGTEIYANAARQLKKVSLELGGKNPTIVFSDCDFEQALEGALKAAFSNQGQICLCGSRLLVQQPIYEKFRTALVERAASIRIGDPLELETQHGAMVSRAHMEKVLGYIDLARDEGGRILTGGKRRIVPGRCAGGFFIEPTVIEGLPPACRTNREEIFGPVVTVLPFETEDEALSIANGTDYGLAASVWTEDMSKADRMAAALDFGIVWINGWNIRDLDTPFGGFKQSGVGREGTWDSLHFFTQQKTVTKGKI